MGVDPRPQRLRSPEVGRYLKILCRASGSVDALRESAAAGVVSDGSLAAALLSGQPAGADDIDERNRSQRRERQHTVFAPVVIIAQSSQCGDSIDEKT